VLTRTPRVRRAAAYAAGGAAGILPLLAYNRWAFGSPLHLSYANNVKNQGTTGHDTLWGSSQGLFGVKTPRLHTTLELLFAPRGLLTLTPVAAAGALGTILLYRRGRRAEAVVIAAVACAVFLYGSGYYGPFGGFSPGPRYLIPVLPFLAVSLGLAFRRFPLTTAALAAVSALSMLAATTTVPMLSNDDTGRWVAHVSGGDFTRTVLSLLGAGHGWGAILPFAALVSAAVYAAGRATGRLSFARGEIVTAASALVAWALLGSLGRPLLHDGLVGELGLLALAAAAVLAVVAAAEQRELAARWRRRRPPRRAGDGAPAVGDPAPTKSTRA
jgi:hypothetical protein